MASVHLKGGSKLYHAYFKGWDEKSGGWKLVSKSTFSPDKATAQAVADGYERVAKMAGPGGSTGDEDLRRRVFETLRSIVEMAGRDLSPRWTTFADEWLELRGARVKLSTRRAYRTHLKNFETWLGKRGEADLAVGSVTLDLAQAYYATLMEEGASAKTAKNNVLTLSQVMERAVASRMAADNPWPQVERSKGATRERLPFSLAEVAKLLEACEDGSRSSERARDWRTMILLGLCAGARIGDCARMRWEMISRVGEHEVLAWRPIKKTDSAGGGKVVRVPLVDPLKSWLAGLGFSTGPLCPTLYGVKVGNRSGLSEQFGEIVAAAGVDVVVSEAKGTRGILFRSKSFHSFRHTLNSLMFAADVPQEWRMRVLDHESVAVNEGYTHADVKEMARWMEKIDMGSILRLGERETGRGGEGLTGAGV